MESVDSRTGDLSMSVRRVAAGFSFLAILSCGDSATAPPPPPPPPPPQPATVTVSPPNTVLSALEATVRLAAEVRDRSGAVMTGASVSWASSNTTVAAVDASGVVTAVGNGTVTITATAGAAQGNANVTVAQAASAVTVSPAADTLAAGDTLSLAAEAFDANGHRVEDAAFSWSSSDESVATVDDSGLVTAVGAGTAVIGAASVGGASGRARLTVEAGVPSAVAVTPGTVSLAAVGDTVRLAAEVRDGAGRPLPGVAVSWTSSDPSVATVSGSGLVTAVGDGTASVTATSGSASGIAIVTVAQRVASVTVVSAADTLLAGDTLRLEAEALDANGHAVPGAAFSWSSSNESVATVDDSGLVTAVGDGTASVTATSGSASGSATVTVETPNRAPEAVGTIPDQAIQIGKAVALDVSPYFADADGDELRYAAASSNTSVAIVSVSGAAVRIQGVGIGTVTLTVTAHDPAGAGTTQEAKVEVTAPAPDLALTGVSPASTTLTPGDSVTFTFRIRNQGTVASSATTIRVMRSTNPTISRRDTELESYSLSPLGPSQDRPLPVTITVDEHSAPGTIYIGMCVDAVTDESNTRNNCSEGARLMIVRSSGARKSLESGPSVRIRVSRPRESRRPAAPLRGTESR